MDEGDFRGKMMEEDHDTLSEVGTRLETHVETGGETNCCQKLRGKCLKSHLGLPPPQRHLLAESSDFTQISIVLLCS